MPEKPTRPSRHTLCTPASQGEVRGRKEGCAQMRTRLTLPILLCTLPVLAVIDPSYAGPSKVRAAAAYRVARLGTRIPVCAVTSVKRGAAFAQMVMAMRTSRIVVTLVLLTSAYP